MSFFKFLKIFSQTYCTCYMSRVRNGLDFHIVVYVFLRCVFSVFFYVNSHRSEESLTCLLDLSSKGEAERSCPMIDGFMWGDLRTSNTTLVAR